MAWIYLAESEDLASLSANGLNQSPIAKSIPTVKQSSCPELRVLNLRTPQYGMILKHWNGLDSHGDMSISYLEVSRVKGLVLQGLEKAWQMSEAGYFSRSCGWPKKSNPSSYSLKTYPQLLQEGESAFLGNLPRWGMTVDGVLYPLLPAELPTKETGSSYLPTPTTMDSLPPRSIEAQQRVFQTHRKGRTAPCNLREWIHPEMWPTPRAQDAGTAPSEARRNTPSIPCLVYQTTGKKLNPLFVEWMMGYPEGWTELSPWAMQWFLSKRKKHLKS